MHTHTYTYDRCFFVKMHACAHVLRYFVSPQKFLKVSDFCLFLLSSKDVLVKRLSIYILVLT